MNGKSRKTAPKPPQKLAEPANLLDDIDRRILKAMQADGRMTIQAIADRIGLSASPCLRRIRRMEEAGIITAYSVTIDQKSVGLPVSVFVSIKLERQRSDELDRFGEAIADWPEVMECYLMTGDSDYLLRVVVPDLGAYERFVMDFTKIPGIAQIRSSFALRPVKQGTALPLS
jgi:Lrp/AsnC family leucine-responsive transcriptional regulator